MEGSEDVVIVGAGIAGLAAAVGLQRMGQRRVVVLESSATLRASGFAITTWSNAWRALDALGVGDSLRSRHLRLRRLTATSTISGSITAQMTLTKPGKQIEEHEARCLKRNVLVETLADQLPRGTVRFSSKLLSIDRAGDLHHLRLADGSSLRAKVVIGCDGINSVVARWLGLKAPTFSGRYAARGLAVFPHGHDIKPEFAQFFGKGYRAGMLPCDQESVYWFFTWTSGEEDDELIRDAGKVRQLVLSRMKAAEAVEELLRVIKSSDLSSVACAPLRYRSPLNLLWGDMSRGGVCVIGDAFHPMTPDLAEGGCSALEDGVLLARCLGECLLGGGADEWGIEEALKKYARARRWRSFELVAASSLVGFLQEGGSWAMNALRDQLLAPSLANRLLSEADFDCGELAATST